MKEYDAYLFDADGTLIDTKEMILQAYLHMGEAIGAVMPAPSVILGSVGLPVRRQVEFLLGGGRAEEYYTRAAAVYSEYLNRVYRDHLRIFPGVADGLAALAGMGKRLAVVTSRRRASLETFLGHLGIARYFPLLVTPEDTAAHKPDPAPCLHALKALGAEASRTVFIGDAGFDILCGKGAGVDTAFVAWGGNPVETLSAKPDFIAMTFGDLLPENKG